MTAADGAAAWEPTAENAAPPCAEFVGNESPEDVAPSADRLTRAIDANYDFLWRSLRRLGVQASAVDDAMQNVFVVASRKMGGVPEDKDRAFLFRVAVGIAANACRSARRDLLVAASDTINDVASHGCNVEDALDTARARAVLDAVLDELPDDLRTVFVLVELEELSAPEAAALLGLPGGTIASRLRRARERFSAACARQRARMSWQGGAR